MNSCLNWSLIADNCLTMMQASIFKFPQRQVVGSLYVAPISQPEAWELLQVPQGLITKPENQPINWRWLDVARGEVEVPPGMKVKLKISSMSVGGISSLTNLDPDSIHVLDVSRTQLADDSLRHISHLTGLKVLELAYTAVTNEGLTQLKSLARLESLGLTHTAVTNSGLAYLDPMTSLKELWLNGTLIDDEGLPHLCSLRELMLLGLSGTRVTDEGLEALAGLENLLRVYLFNTAITSDGAQNLRQKAPRCRVKWRRSSPGEGEMIGSGTGLDLMDELSLISKELSADDSVAPLLDEEFWGIIDMLDWDADSDEQKIEPCVLYLADSDDELIYSFLETLSEKLYELDGERFARHIGRASYQGHGKHFSRSWYLNARCCVVANGQEAFEEVLSDPSSMPKDLGFRILTQIAEDAFSRKHGGRKLEYTTRKSSQTFSNKEGWSGL